MIGAVIRAGLLLAVPAGPAAHAPAPDPQRVRWNRPQPPFRVHGDVYYVGTAGLAAFLVTGSDGHVLIDGALPESAPIIAGNIRALGFRPADIRYLLVNHAHYDHAGGVAALQRLSGARVIVGAADAADLRAGHRASRPSLPAFPAVRPDRLARDGDVVRLGPIRLTAIATPGHTIGSVSWVTKTGGKRVLFASSLSVAGQSLICDPSYPTAARDFRATFRRLRRERADIFLTFHPEFFDMAAKHARQQRGDGGAFDDPKALARAVTAAEGAFNRTLAEQRAAVRPCGRAAVPR